jgi:hypothetical protein
VCVRAGVWKRVQGSESQEGWRSRANPCTSKRQSPPFRPSRTDARRPDPTAADTTRNATPPPLGQAGASSAVQGACSQAPRASQSSPPQRLQPRPRWPPDGREVLTMSAMVTTWCATISRPRVNPMPPSSVPTISPTYMPPIVSHHQRNCSGEVSLHAVCEGSRIC